MPPRGVLVGTAGYGAVQLGLLRTFARRNQITLAGAVMYQPDVDLRRTLEEEGCRTFRSLEELVSAWNDLRPDFAVLPTPIHLHVRMASVLLQAGAHVLVEKPIAPTMDGARELARCARECGRVLAVGFQYLHAPEVQALKRRLVAGEIGRIRRIVVHAAWPRGRGYYARNGWAGRVRVGGEWVHDSPVNNAMAHFLLLMLFLAGDAPESVAEPVRMRVELYRAQAIETFDTAVLRMEAAGGAALDFYGTHSSREITRPSLRIMGDEGVAHWVQDGHASMEGNRGSWRQDAKSESHTRECMLGDVLARCRGEKAFYCDPEMAMAHVRCVEALSAGPSVYSVPAAALATREENGDVFTFIRHFDDAFRSAAIHGIGLRAAGLAWARDPVEAGQNVVSWNNGRSGAP